MPNVGLCLMLISLIMDLNGEPSRRNKAISVDVLVIRSIMLGATKDLLRLLVGDTVMPQDEQFQLAAALRFSGCGNGSDGLADIRV